MQIIADLHIHSKYSRAVSQKMDLHGIGSWASIKGIDLVSTGDYTHPIWLREITMHLKETSPGLYELKKPVMGQQNPVKFMLTTEISSIYSQAGKTRRMHNIIFAPSIAVAEKINKELLKRGTNLMSDGRPITGIPSKDLLEMVLSIDERCLFVPAHIWTPWFSLFGSKSGFDSIEECFGKNSRYIYAIETGLSSDPIMNWGIKDLENLSILSFSDAHSGPKLGREATVFVPAGSNPNLSHRNYSYDDIIDAIKQKAMSPLKIGYTIEFFPEEGKYHWTGHRACNIQYGPDEEKKNGVICPVCGKPLTVGVVSRVADLSTKLLTDKDLLFAQNSAGLTFIDDTEKKRRPFVSIIPLLEVMLELEGGSPTKAERRYHQTITDLGSEFDILLKIPYAEIASYGGELMKKAIETIRTRHAHIDPGYDGVFGTVRLFKDEKQIKKLPTEKQPVLFSQ
ncbi:MAG: endonuclease Q family protein [Patescibacteria group bacterium]